MRRRHATRARAPSASEAPPALPIAIPMTCGRLSDETVVGEEVSDANGVEVLEVMLTEGVDDEEVVRNVDCNELLEVVCILEEDMEVLLVLLAVTPAEIVFETLELVVVEAGGNSSTPLDVGFSTRVAVRVACVFDRAPTWPIHMAYASSTTAWVAFAPVQALILSSEMIHWTAPSAIVYPEVELCEQRHCNDGEIVQALIGKLASRNDSKQAFAQSGTKLESSADNKKDVEALEDVLVNWNRHISSSKPEGNNAIIPKSEDDN